MMTADGDHGVHVHVYVLNTRRPAGATARLDEVDPGEDQMRSSAFSTDQRCRNCGERLVQDGEGVYCPGCREWVDEQEPVPEPPDACTECKRLLEEV